MIKIRKSSTADTCTSRDPSSVSKVQLLSSSYQHVNDIQKGFNFFIKMMIDSSEIHDHDKFSGIDHFHSDFITSFKKTGWWDNHRKVNRHHLQQADGVPEDVNLIDVLDMIIDCVMAGMGRSGEVYKIDIKPVVLNNAFNNTVGLLKAEVEVEQ